MSSDNIEALIVSGCGINCERETAFAFDRAGAKTRIAHIRSLLDNPDEMLRYRLLCFPGGFSFGDDKGAGQLLANKIQEHAGFVNKLETFVAQGNAILGICNGFQLLIKLGLLPGNEIQGLSLVSNRSGKFENRWSHHTISPHSIFTQNLGKKSLYLPVRHGEGRFIAKEPQLIDALFRQRRVVMQYADTHGRITEHYPDNPDGSECSIAALTDKTGRILGMMAHPEAAILHTHHPAWTSHPRQGDLDGFILLKNGIDWLKRNKN